MEVLVLSIGEKIKNLRIKLGYTQDELASSAKTTKQTIYKYETGVITNIPASKLLLIAEKLETSPAYLMGWEDNLKSSEKITLKEAELIKSFKALNSEEKEKVIEYTKALQQKMPVLIIENEPRYLVRRAGRDGSFSEEYLTKEEIEKIKEEANALEEANF